MMTSVRTDEASRVFGYTNVVFISLNTSSNPMNVLTP
jgi:hypothetical protein